MTAWDWVIRLQLQAEKQMAPGKRVPAWNTIQAGEYLRVNIRQLRQLVEEFELPQIFYGGSKRYIPSEVRQWEKRNGQLLDDLRAGVDITPPREVVPPGAVGDCYRQLEDYVRRHGLDETQSREYLRICPGDFRQLCAKTADEPLAFHVVDGRRLFSPSWLDAWSERNAEALAPMRDRYYIRYG